MDTFKNLVRNNMRQYAMLFALLLAIVIFQIATGGILLVPMNVTNLILQNAYVFILAIGMMILLINGGNIDLSVGSVVAFIGAITGTLIITLHVNVALTVALAILIGALIGVWQGFWIAYVGVPGFIATLAGLLLFRGLTLNTLKGGITLSPFPSSFQSISGGFIFNPFAGVSSSVDILTLVVGFLISLFYVISELNKRRRRSMKDLDTIPIYLFVLQLVSVFIVLNVFAFWLGRYRGIPIIFAVIIVLILVYSVITARTVPGRHIYAMGGNEKSAKLSGINTKRLLFLCYVNMGVLAAVASIAYTSRLNAASPEAGTNFELDAISACFVGGASMYGGVGTIVGVIIGALFMGVINNGMSILGAGTDVQLGVKGLVLLFAVAFDLVSKSRANAV